MPRLGYQYGYTYIDNDSSYRGTVFLLVLACPIAFVLYLGFYLIFSIIMIVKKGIRILLTSVSLLVLSIVAIGLMFALSKGIAFHRTEGFYDRIKVTANVDEISEWLINLDYSNYEKEEYSESIKLLEHQYPPSIKMLNPLWVVLKERNSKKYARLVYGSGMEGDFGLVIHEEGLDIPLDDFDDSEYRIPLPKNGFVWNEIEKNIVCFPFPIPQVQGVKNLELVALYFYEKGSDDGSYPPNYPHADGVMIAIWGDGTIVWSSNLFRGGPPYYKGKITLDEIENIYSKINSKKLFKSPLSDAFISKWQGDQQCLFVQKEKEYIHMISSHKVSEQSGDRTNSLPLEIQYAFKEYPPQSKKHKQFRRNWDYIIETLKDSIPEQGEEIENLTIDNQGYEIDLGW